MRIYNTFETKEELLIYQYLGKFLSGNAGPTEKVRRYQRSCMSKRRKLGLTQKANRDYQARNKLALALYDDFMKLEPSLIRTGEHSFGRKDESANMINMAIAGVKK